MKQRKDGRWRKVVTINGKKECFYSSAPTEKQAEKEIIQKIANYNEKKKAEKSFPAIAEEWNAEYREGVPDHNYYKNTRTAYNRIFEYFKDNKDINNITALDINIFIDTLIAMQFSRKTIANHKSILNMIFRYAVIHSHTLQNPVQYIKLPRGLPEKPRDIPATDELIEITKHTEGFDLLPFFMLYTGCRRSEALAIRDTDIDFENKIIKIRNHVIHSGNKPIFENVLKTGAAKRDIILLDRLADVIPKNFKGFLFSMHGDGKEPLTRSAYDRRLEAYCKRYNLTSTAHQLRHGFATMLYEAGISDKDAQDLIGHSDINLTRQVYTHIRDERKKQTAEKLNDFTF